ncbi:MAG: lysozyme [Muribaculaceae bacterium]|nr:lysozyme [Muribaculaceae bacterium]
MKTSQQMIDLIMQWEGFRAKAYRCPSGVLTVGYGHTGAEITPETTVTTDEATGMLLADIRNVERCIASMSDGAGVVLTQHQFDALVSLAFNIGSTRLRRSMLWRKISINAPTDEITREFRRWVYAGGKIMPGLVKRREREASIYSGQGYA